MRTCHFFYYRRSLSSVHAHVRLEQVQRSQGLGRLRGSTELMLGPAGESPSEHVKCVSVTGMPEVQWQAWGTIRDVSQH